MYTFFRYLLATTIAMGPALYGLDAQAQQPPAVVELTSVTERESSSVVKLPGTVISTRDAQIASEVAGRLTWVAEVGDYIQAGEPVAIIDDHLFQLRLRNNQAEIARIDADIDYNDRLIQRLQKLAAQNNMAQSELDEVESRLEMLRQEKRIAEVDRDRTEYDLDRSKVTAPFAGVVASRTMTLGEYTSAGTALIRLVDTDALEISVNAPLRVAHYNSAGVEVQIEADDRQTLVPIRGIVPVGDPTSRMLELRLSVPGGEWLIGEAVTVEIPDSQPKSMLTVPRDALVLRDNETFIYTVSGDTTALKVPVIAGPGRGSNIAIEARINAGDPVIIRGAENLRDGQALKIIQHHIAASPN